jgi:hypothetical protein
MAFWDTQLHDMARMMSRRSNAKCYKVFKSCLGFFLFALPFRPVQSFPFPSHHSFAHCLKAALAKYHDFACSRSNQTARNKPTKAQLEPKKLSSDS